MGEVDERRVWVGGERWGGGGGGGSLAWHGCKGECAGAGSNGQNQKNHEK